METLKIQERRIGQNLELTGPATVAELEAQAKELEELMLRMRELIGGEGMDPEAALQQAREEVAIARTARDFEEEMEALSQEAADEARVCADASRRLAFEEGDIEYLSRDYGRSDAGEP